MYSYTKNGAALTILWNVMAFFAVALGCGGCASLPRDFTAQGAIPAATLQDEKLEKVKIREFYPSPGDEINITVYKHPDLARKITIPADGEIFFPMAGIIDVKGKNLREVREVIISGLSEYKDNFIQPDDEIMVDVFGQTALGRKITIPPDGHIFVPLVGDIDTTGKTLREVREVIVNGLSRYRDPNLSPGDEISITVFRRDELNRKLTIPPDETFFYPLVGEISTKGKSPREVRQQLAADLSRYFKDVQVEVNLAFSPRIKLVVDPQVTVDAIKVSGYRRIPDPQVGIEVTSFGGQKIFVLGEVRNPGVFHADGGTTLFEAILKAGSFTLEAKPSNVLLIRWGEARPKPQLIVANLEKVLSEGTPEGSLVLQKGDLVYVPRTLISDVDRFFTHLSTIVSPLLSLETGYYIGTQIDAASKGSAIIAK